MIVDQVYRILSELSRERRVTLLINEQSSQRVLRYSDRIYVIRGGAIRLHGRAADLQDGDAIMRAYFGFDEVAPSGEGRTAGENAV
jgi:branched-chain amino acid transport system ATP-binding protein